MKFLVAALIFLIAVSVAHADAVFKVGVGSALDWRDPVCAG
jgi:hypothetical protein